MNAQLTRVLGRRHGLFLPPATVPPNAADGHDIIHVSVSDERIGGLASAGGGVGRTREVATNAAIGESLERYSAAASDIDPSPTRRHDDAVSFASWAHHHDGSPSWRYCDGPWATVWSLHSNQPADAPAALVGLGEFPGQPSTSNGLAAHPDVFHALLRGAQELIERDALVATFLHGLGGRRIERIGTFDVFDLTQQWSPHPVVAVCGDRPLAGRTRWSFGSACRASYDEAIERAYLECEQGIVFVGTLLTHRPSLMGMGVDQVVSFDHHALYYSANPDQLDVLPLLRGATDHVRRYANTTTAATNSSDSAAVLADLVEVLRSHGVHLWYRDVTTIDVAQVGMRAVRVLSEQLAPLPHHHLLRPTGGTAPDLAWRWPDAEALVDYPSPYPHPLG